jgi:hypothetical protein
MFEANGTDLGTLEGALPVHDVGGRIFIQIIQVRALKSSSA